MSPPFTVTYFNGRGLAEHIRALLKYGKLEFEDVRVEVEAWPAKKESTPFGQLPLLEHKGRVINQSVAIARYVGRIVGLAGKDELEDALIDAIADTVSDIRIKVSGIYYENDPEGKKVIREKCLNEHIPYYFGKLDAIAAKNGGHLALGRLTWADVFFTFAEELMEAGTETKGLLDKYPNLKKLSESVKNQPEIKKWIEERPVTEW